MDEKRNRKVNSQFEFDEESTIKSALDKAKSFIASVKSKSSRLRAKTEALALSVFSTNFLNALSIVKAYSEAGESDISLLPILVGVGADYYYVRITFSNGGTA